MLMRASDVIGHKVITMSQGKKVEDVDDVIYSPVDNKVRALLVDKGGMFSHAKVILIEDIKSIGTDAVLIEDEIALKNSKEVAEPIADISEHYDYLSKTKIITEEGTELGKVSDLIFETTTGQVEEFEVSQGGLKNIQSGKKRIKIEDIITVGKDATIVRKATEYKMEEQQGGAKGLYNSGSETISEKSSNVADESKNVWNQAKKDMKKLSKNIQQKITDTKNDPNNQQHLENLKTKGINLKDKAEQQFHQTKDTAQQKYSEMRVEQKESTIQNAVGTYITKNILLPDDTLLAKRGQMITNEMIALAEQNGVLDQILNNSSKDPIIS